MTSFSPTTCTPLLLNTMDMSMDDRKVCKEGSKRWEWREKEVLEEMTSEEKASYPDTNVVIMWS